jgi:hypothetical protein
MINHDSLCEIHPGVQVSWTLPWKFGSDLIVEAEAWAWIRSAHERPRALVESLITGSLVAGHYQGPLLVTPAQRDALITVVTAAVDDWRSRDDLIPMQHWLGRITDDQMSAVLTCQHRPDPTAGMTTQQLVDKLLSGG